MTHPYDLVVRRPDDREVLQERLDLADRLADHAGADVSAVEVLAHLELLADALRTPSDFPAPSCLEDSSRACETGHGGPGR